METLQLLGTALGIAALSGLNLYLTVFVTGLAIRFDWVHLAPQYESLAVLGHPVILAISGTFFLLEFFADKIPWVDTIWDTVHTLIRPVGGALLAILALGEPNPVFDVVVGLLACTVALSTHTLKSASRLVVNASPEPFSNIMLSFAEDLLVIGGLGLLVWNPLVALGLVVVFLASCLYFGPKIFRIIRSRLFFAWKKLNAPAVESAVPEGTSLRVPVDVECLLHQKHPAEVHLEWVLACHSAGIKGLPSNTRGYLVAVRGEPPSIYWVYRSWFGLRWKHIEARDIKAEYTRGFLYDKLTIYSPSGGVKWCFAVDRGSRMLAENILRLIGQTPAVAAPAVVSDTPPIATSRSAQNASQKES
jgi:hypothetical protein